MGGHRVAELRWDLIVQVGLRNVHGNDAERYPHVTPEDVAAHQPDTVVQPDEPYRFTATEGAGMFPGGPPSSRAAA